MPNIHNFRVTVTDQNGKKHVICTKNGSVTIEQRHSMSSYSDELLKVSLIVLPSAKLQTRARFTTQYVETTHHLMHETDPVYSEADWLGLTDEQIANKIKHSKWRIKTRKGKKNV